MADTKITALTALTAADPANDVLPIVDVSDTTMAASGTTKKISVNNILGASGTATLASATITGDLTVKTNVLKVDTTNNRVGIGTASPVNTLEVVAPAGDNIVSTFRSGDATAANNAGGGFRSISSATAANRVAQVWLDADGANFSGGDYFFIQKNGGSGTVEFNQSSNAAMVFLTNSTERYRIASDGVATWSNVGGVAGTAMTLNSTGLGVGGSPTAKLSVVATGKGFVFGSTSASGAYAAWQYNSADVGYVGNGTSIVAGAAATDFGLTSYAGGKLWLGSNNGASYAVLDTSGNVGIGVTPSAGGGCLQLKSGITFPATQVASSDANTLDDYEEGTFTPTIEGTSTAGTASYSVQLGRYTKIGRVVQYELYVAWSGGTGTGDLKVTGLPFTANGTIPSISSVYPINLALTAGYYASGSVSAGTNSIFMAQLPTGGGGDASIAYDAAAQLIITGTYTV